jgi:hypothetical protein
MTDTTWTDEEARVFGDDAPSANGSKPISPALSLGEDAYHGIAGEIVGLVEPHTEADPAAVLLQVVTMAGSVFGRGPHFRVEADRHGTNIYSVLVGESSRSRKGSSRGHAQQAIGLADPEWASECVQSGLSSGEGLIHAVRDPTTKTVDGEEVITDPGVTDKRLLLVEPEFASTLRVMGRDGSTLSAALRQAWDGGDLRVLTRNNPLKAAGTHISVIGHITDAELLRELNTTDQSNGFANRFIFAYVQRSKLLPEGGAAHTIDWRPVVQALERSIAFTSSLDRPIARDAEAREMWAGVYPKLTAGHPGMLGAITSRAEAQVMRLALIYAVLDCSKDIKAEHLRAALAIWAHAEASCRRIFGDALGDPDADEILRGIRQASGGLTRTQVHDLFGRHRKAAQIDRSLGVLLEHGLVRVERQETGGRPTERWTAV